MSWLSKITGAMNKDQFAQRLIDCLQSAGELRDVRYDAAAFQLRFYDGGIDVGFANLSNLYGEFSTTSRVDRELFFRSATRALLAAHKPVPADFSDAQHDVMPTIRNRSYFTVPGPQVGRADDFDGHVAWPYQQLGEHLGVGLVYDLPEAMLMLQAEHLETWDVSFYEAYEYALANLAELDATFATIDDFSYVSNSEDHYDASRILLTEMVAELDVKGNAVVLLPNRDRLIVTGSEDTQGLETAALTAKQLMKHPRPITGIAFAQSGADMEWTPWLPGTDHPAFTPLKSLALASVEEDYALQYTQLMRRHRAHPAFDPMPMAFLVHDSGSRQPPFSYCIWQEGKDCLLPKTDRICFLKEDETPDHALVESINVAWGDVRSVVGKRLREAVDMYPTRFHADGFPNDDELSELRRR